jgi:hypothetical protein
MPSNPNARFAPGVTSTDMRNYLIKKYLEQRFINSGRPMVRETMCICRINKERKIKNTGQSYNNTSRPNAVYLSSMLSNTPLKGRITYGNANTARPVLFNGGMEGQPGGIPAVLKNIF